MNWLLDPAPSAVLGVVTTIHASLLLLRRHLNPRLPSADLLLVPSLLLATTPWLAPTPPWLLVGFAVHLGWFAVAGAIATRARAAAAARAASAVRAESAAVTAAAVAPAPPAEAPADPPPVSVGFVQTPVLAVFRDSEDIRTFRFLRPEGIDFTPGQFVTVRVQVDGKPLVRCYSISSAPESSGYLEISVKRFGQVSSTLHATVRPGSMLTIKGPAGAFTYPGRDDRPIVLLAGGVGITPLMSMLRHGVVAEPMRPITLLYSVRNEQQYAFRQELEWLRARHPQFHLVPVIGDGEVSPGHARGFINDSLLREAVPDVTGAIYMICGPGPMMDAMRKMLAAAGVPESQIRFEVFQAAIAMAAEPAVAAVRATREKAAAASPQRAGSGYTLTLTRSGVKVPVKASQTLLEAAEAGGVSLQHSCRAGVCLACRCRVLEGEVQCTSDSLDERDRQASYILPCVTWAKGDCVVEA